MDTLFKQGMSKLAGGVTLITTGRGASRRGITATAVCSLSVSPPSLIACANQATGTGQSIRDHGVFCVNVLGTQHRDIAMIFAGATGLNGAARFEHGQWLDHELGVPCLRGAVASFICAMETCVPYGSHFAFVGAVRDVLLPETAEAPIAWLGSAFQNLTPACNG